MNPLKIKFQNDQLFQESKNQNLQMHSELFDGGYSDPIQRKEKFILQDHILKSDTVSAILAQPEEQKILALNFANAMFPGGAYILGGTAQEESLCCSSFLYYTIRTVKKYYQHNRAHVLPDYTNYAIYSEHVPIIRDHAGNFLDSPRMCDFITCPAVNRNFARFFFSGKKLNAIMQNRIENIIMLAADHEPDILILGAFGCGMFGNRREVVYPMFEQVINKYIPDQMKVIFADPAADHYLHNLHI